MAAPAAAAMPAGAPAPAMQSPMVGAERMAQMQQVATRVNHAHFQRLAPGSAVRVAGHFREPRSLTTTDGGVISVVPEPQDDLSAFQNGFFEVVGTKAEDGTLQATAVLPLPGELDLGLWDEMVNMCNEPQLKHLFGQV